MEKPTLWPSRVKRAVMVAAPIVALILAGLACGAPTKTDDLSSHTGGGPYFTCRTATPIPTVTYVSGERQFTATPNAEGTLSGEIITEREYGFTTPVPTETPYYRQGEFYLNQPAIFDASWEVELLGAAYNSTYTDVSMRLRNRSGVERAAALSVSLVAVDANGSSHSYNPEAQTALGLGDAVVADSAPVPPGGESVRHLAFTGPVSRVGLMTGWLNDVARPVWFVADIDPEVKFAGACAHGGADWQASDSGNYGTHGEGVSEGGGSVPPPPPVGQYSPRPRVSGGTYPVNQPWYFASTYHPPGHNGLDLTACFASGCSTTAEERLLRMGNSRPIYAVMAGEVVMAQCSWNGGYGCYVIIRTPIGPDDALYTYYAHMWGGGGVAGSFRSGVADPTCDPTDCARTTITALGNGPGPLVSKGQTLTCADIFKSPIGYMGMSGSTTGPHLHWEVRRGSAGVIPPYTSQFDPESSRTFWCAASDSEGVIEETP